VRHPIRALTVGALIVSLAAAGCTKVGNGTGAGNQDDAKATPIVVDTKGEYKGPAAPVPGAKPGGNVTVLQEGDFEYLDPQQIYVSNALETGTALFHRMLTNYIEDPSGKQLKLVGDLATNTGETTDGKVWTYHLRDGIKYEDGTAITAQDIAYGLSRSFSDYGLQGPQYFQNAIDPQREYKGPYAGGKMAPGIETPDAKTLRLTFPSAHPEVPYLMAFPTSTPIPAAKDTKDKYNTEWISSGPYKRKEYLADSKLVLERNPNWDPNSDPIRHQYPDTITFDFTSTGVDQTERVSSGQGADATALMTANVDPANIANVKADAELMKRVDTSATPFVSYLWINTARVTDLKVRQALNYAFNRDSYIKAVGGTDVATPATTIMAPIVPGYKQFDVYAAADGGNIGDPAKAKQLLAGQKPKLKYCVSNSALNQQVAPIIVEGLSREGNFDIVINYIPPADYYKTVGVKGTDCDLIAGGWGGDYPDGAATLDVLLNGEKIVASGNNNLSYLNASAINTKLDQLLGLTDRSAASSQYGDLDETIMKDYAPAIPLRYVRNFTIAGPGVGGAFVSPLFAQFNLNNVYVK
jgi:peptide/nickel transport system substrate-binding protein